MNDKVKHFLVNFGLVVILGFAVGVVAGLVSAVCFSVGKEIYDKFVRKTVFSVDDLIADMLGIIAGLICLSI